MSQQKKTKKEIKTDASEIVVKPLEQVIHESMMPYSEFVIMDRALPRVEDGLKPVQRRVLYSMLEVGVTPDKPYRKSARIVGDCMGKYHPHGDRSIYDTMVRMAQSFNMRETLIDGHGNFGSIDGDGAAAMRYTEARLSPISLELLRDIEKDTVTWSFNFDDTTKEPDMLPGRFPNLLVNGATGIAVGLATNIPTHNLSEVIDAVVAYIDNNKITIDELLKIMPAPDFPTGGYVLSNSEFKQVYSTGKGKIILRAKVEVEKVDDRANLVITEIPYQVNKAVLLQKIAKLKESDNSSNYAGIIDIVDESDRNGTRAVIKLKKGTNISNLLKLLYKNSDLQVNFNVNMVAIAGGKPKLLNLLEIISYYVEYQKEVIYRRTKYDLDVSEKREHILSGLLIAIQNIDQVIAIIKTSKSTNEAKTNLMQTFALSDVQAQAILDMRLARLTNLEVNKIVTELENLRQLIIKLKRILASDKLQYNIIKTELLEIKKNYGNPRRTQILNVDENEEAGESSLKAEENIVVNEEEMVVIYSAGNTIKAVNRKNYNKSQKELSVNNTVNEIPHLNINLLNTKTLYLFTNLGNCHTVKVYDIPVCKFKDKGELLTRIIKNYENNEKVIAMIDLENNLNNEIIMVTKLGQVKVTKCNEYVSAKQTINAIKLNDNDEVVMCEINNANLNLALFTNLGYALSFNKEDIKPIGRVSLGVKGIKLSEDDFVVNAHQINQNSAFAVFMNNGNAKVIKASEVAELARGRKGSKIIPNNKTLKLVNCYLLVPQVSFVTRSTNKELTFVLNKKMVLEDKLGAGKNVLQTKNKTNMCEEVFRYEVIEEN